MSETDEQSREDGTAKPKPGIPVFERHYLCLPQHQLVYCRVPKAANSSIRDVMARLIGLKPRAPDVYANQDWYWSRIPSEQATAMTRKQFLNSAFFRQGWSFTFVRHPVSRMYSCWHNKVVANKTLSPKFLEMGITEGMSFEGYIERVAACDDLSCDIHVRSQMALIAFEGRILPNFVGRVERMDEDWDHVMYETHARLGIRLPWLRQENVRVKATPDLAHQLPRRTLELIAQRYHQDFTALYPEFLTEFDLDPKPPKPTRP